MFGRATGKRGLSLSRIRESRDAAAQALNQKREREAGKEKKTLVCPELKFSPSSVRVELSAQPAAIWLKDALKKYLHKVRDDLLVATFEAAV